MIFVFVVISWYFQLLYCKLEILFSERKKKQIINEEVSSSPNQPRKAHEEVDEDNDKVEVIPSEIMGVEEGFPRMALVMAFFLHTERDLEEQIRKDLARAMVGVWITYGFTYQQMCKVFQSRDQQEVKVDMLRNMLNTKVSEGFLKPVSFGFSKLIKLTLFYFSHAV